MKKTIPDCFRERRFLIYYLAVVLSSTVGFTGYQAVTCGRTINGEKRTAEEIIDFCKLSAANFGASGSAAAATVLALIAKSPDSDDSVVKAGIELGKKEEEIERDLEKPREEIW